MIKIYNKILYKKLQIITKVNYLKIKYNEKPKLSFKDNKYVYNTNTLKYLK